MNASNEALRKKANDLLEAGYRKVNVVYKNNVKSTLRIFKEAHTNTICAFRRRSRKDGYYLDFNYIQDIQSIDTRKTPSGKWNNGWMKVKSRLEKSGLWKDVIADINIALKMGYDTIRKASDDYWCLNDQKSKDAFLEDYPLLKAFTEDGKQYINTIPIWQMSSPPKVKKMRFERKCYNDTILDNIQKAMDEKCEHYASGKERYDVSFTYNPERNQACYSEEFRGCGNGHYYLALDATHAMFWEDD